MKVFKFDPATGQRGDLIQTTQIVSWTSRFATAADLIGDLPTPQGFGTDSDVTIHMNAGRGFGDDEISYRQPFEWVCFCMGNWQTGHGGDAWEWIVLPPESALAMAHHVRPQNFHLINEQSEVETMRRTHVM